MTSPRPLCATESNRMSPQITFKSTPSRAPAPGEALTDSAGKPLPPPPSLAQGVPAEYPPRHRKPPDRLPPPPHRPSHLRAAPVLRVIGTERQEGMQGEQA